MSVITFTNRRGLRLVADHYEADSSAVVVPVHGYTSNRFSQGRFPYIASALNAAGYAAFAFDHAGCGASDDDGLCLSKLVQDVLDATAHVKQMGYRHIALWGT